jgi:hypothetical protein
MTERELKNDELIDEMNRLAPDYCKNCEYLHYDDEEWEFPCEKKDIDSIATWCMEFDMDCYDCLPSCQEKREDKLCED